MQRLPKRIFIIGPPGSGKSYLADRLSELTGIKHYDTDDMRYIRKYDTVRPIAARRRKLVAVAKRDSWIIAGVSLSFSDAAIERSQLIVILWEKFHLTAFRIIRRSIMRVLSKMPSKESVGGTLKLVKWNYEAFHKKGGKQAELLGQIRKEYGHKVLVLKSKKEVATFIEKFR
jgi:adenylate kinase family enzyme